MVADSLLRSSPVCAAVGAFGMNIYQREMLKTYGVIGAIFSLLPFVIALLIYPSDFVEQLKLFILPLVTGILCGYVLSPIFGPRIGSNKSLSFLMAFLCALAASLSYAIALFFPSLETSGTSILKIVLLSAVFMWPAAVIAGVMYIGACQRIQTAPNKLNQSGTPQSGAPV